jgi:hypothetical protein
MNCHTNAGIVDSNPNQGMDICVRLFCVVLCVRADPSSKETYRLCIGLETEKAAKVQQKDCRAMGRYGFIRFYRHYRRHRCREGLSFLTRSNLEHQGI